MMCEIGNKYLQIVIDFTSVIYNPTSETKFREKSNSMILVFIVYFLFLLGTTARDEGKEVL
jgi:hypothetical protein